MIIAWNKATSVTFCVSIGRGPVAMENRAFVWIILGVFIFSFIGLSLTEEEEVKKVAQYHCHTCNSGDPKEPNVNCLGNSSVNFQTTWKANCTEKCFIRTNILYPGTTYRGCTDLFPQLPKPLAEDGCYKYYLDAYCLCSTELCNGDPMGEPMDKELDEHLWDSTGQTPGDDDDPSGAEKRPVFLYPVIVTLLTLLYLYL